jgi:outer membrane immunogenic protein
MKKAFFVISALLASTALASAADLAVKPYKTAPYVAPVSIWQGFYIGGHGGYAWSDSITIGATGVGTVTGSSSDFNGGFGGGQIGYNWQFSPNWVFGIETDAAGADISTALRIFSATRSDPRFNRSARSLVALLTPRTIG